jgi:molybdate-binding protein
LEKGNPKGITSLRDLARADIRFVNRQVGSGTRVLLELLLSKEKIRTAQALGYESAEFTHAAVAAFVASGMVDVGFGVETATRRFNLDFLPVVREQYFFATERKQLDDRRLSLAVKLMASDEIRHAIAALAGYDGAMSGTVAELDDAANLTT